MLQADFARFRNVMAGMAELYQRELSATLLDAYWLALCEWPLGEFEAAAARLMQTETFMPRPAAFHALREAGRQTATEAWNHVVANCTRWRNGQQGDADPAIDAALRRIGGNESVAMCQADQLHWLEKRFSEAYDELRDAAQTREALPQLKASAMLSAGVRRIGRGAA